MKWISTIEKIGKKAVDSKDGMVILFGEGANEDLKDVSIIQKFNPSTPINSFIFKKEIPLLSMVKHMLQTMLDQWLKAI